jgi:hypothetical protein
VGDEPLSAAAEQSDSMFTLWLASLDAGKIAAEESFLSEGHRLAMHLHEERKEALKRGTRAKEQKRKHRIDQLQWAQIRFNRIAS